MKSNICTKNISLVDGDGNNRTFQVSKFTAFNGIILGKNIITKILPLVENLLPSKDMGNKKELKKVVKELDSSILDKISLEQVSTVLSSFSDEDLNDLVLKTLSNVGEVLPAQVTSVIDEYGNYQVDGVEYDPIFFITLIWEELKFGLSDFFKGDRWLSLLPKA